MKYLTRAFRVLIWLILFKSLTMTHTRGVTVPSAPPSGFKLNWTDAFTAMIYWDELNANNGPVQGYKIMLCNVLKGCEGSQLINATTKENKPKAIIRNLEANHLYKAKFAAYNNEGTGPWSSSSWNSIDSGVFVFNTNIAPPNRAPFKLQVWVKDKDVKIKWKNPTYYFTKVNGIRAEIWLQNQTSNDAFGFNKENDENKEEQDNEVEVKLDYSDFKVWVRAYNSGGRGKPSEALAFSTRMGKEEIYGGAGSDLRTSLLLMTISLLLWLLLDNAL